MDKEIRHYVLGSPASAVVAISSNTSRGMLRFASMRVSDSCWARRSQRLRRYTWQTRHLGAISSPLDSIVGRNYRLAASIRRLHSEHPERLRHSSVLRTARRLQTPLIVRCFTSRSSLRTWALKNGIEERCGSLATPNDAWSMRDLAGRVGPRGGARQVAFLMLPWWTTLRSGKRREGRIGKEGGGKARAKQCVFVPERGRRRLCVCVRARACLRVRVCACSPAPACVRTCVCVYFGACRQGGWCR